MPSPALPKLLHALQRCPFMEKINVASFFRAKPKARMRNQLVQTPTWSKKCFAGSRSLLQPPARLLHGIPGVGPGAAAGATWTLRRRASLFVSPARFPSSRPRAQRAACPAQNRGQTIELASKTAIFKHDFLTPPKIRTFTDVGGLQPQSFDLQKSAQGLKT